MAMTLDGTSGITQMTGSIVMSGSTSGTTTIIPSAVAGTTTVTMPAATGTVMVSGNMPAFSAYASTTQSISAATWTKVNFANERFDTNSNFSSSRFTPTVSGYYILSANVYFDSSPAGQAILNLSLNGDGSNGYGLNRMSISGVGAVSGSMVVYMNGTTDYAEIYYYSTGANTLNSGTSTNLVLFTGAMVRNA